MCVEERIGLVGDGRWYDALANGSYAIANCRTTLVTPLRASWLPAMWLWRNEWCCVCCMATRHWLPANWPIEWP